MTPGARVAAAISILDDIRDGQPAEQALTTWARNSRFAGSKDRAAVRDHVFDVLRAKLSLGNGTGRALLAALLRRDGLDVDAFFAGEGHAPAPLSDAEREVLVKPASLTQAQECDVPEWLWDLWQSSLGTEAEAAAIAQQLRAHVYLRVNRRRATVDMAKKLLAGDSISTVPHPTVEGCLRVTENARRVKNSRAYQDGLIELQDAASQFAVREVPVNDGARVLDYCAGGGGKALAFADIYDAQVFAHDIAPQRMKDIPERAARAGVTIETLSTQSLMGVGPFDVVFCDAPCSGSGTWRRTPDAKWRLTSEELDRLTQMQRDVIESAAPLVAVGGALVYATCSVLDVENSKIVEAFCANHPDWQSALGHQLIPGPNNDGFYLNLLRKT
ncbi:RsmB/NOP family class I SAM-dependent RNA methyltransferase [Loktanella sp. S4079]|uniref:RsmB/NOP family class I SAM-dependent RNA methyltransferase n=1 Tax=Loktanella sp. S4079 TaxID=579483 RepID=UPI0005FA0177|nr:RsmB/NOP family class I SAM-dependent RNA methyltransferase [Loktanella sp. S4079]KJZ20019.1 SAM-dependent methlyltransferase [Loktanella sp. S4079]